MKAGRWWQDQQAPACPWHRLAQARALMVLPPSVATTRDASGALVPAGTAKEGGPDLSTTKGSKVEFVPPWIVSHDIAA